MESVKKITLDCCGMQCPGPIMEVFKNIKEMQDGELLVVETGLKAVSGPLTNPVKSVKVRRCDMEWNDTKSVVIDETKGVGIREAFRSGNRLHVLFCQEEKNLLKLRHVILDAQSLDIVADNALVDVTMNKGDEDMSGLPLRPTGSTTE